MNKQYNIVELIELLTHTIVNYEESILEKLQSFDLTVKQFDYIYTINKMKNPSLSELAKELKLSKPSITAIIEKFSRKGYVRKVNSIEDKRSYHVYLTEKGEYIIHEHNAIHQIIADAFINTLCENELNELTALLNKVVCKLK